VRADSGLLYFWNTADIDPNYFSGALPEVDRKQKDNWIPRWQNREAT
jgi:hypothetical protein